ncbi:hypothetical protein [Heliophilum fasciatum]|uniref:DNA ligase (ATP) n=1 Tax=Heliophilum fasciatum TaxID=35700 RepID=A0A4R2RLW7_9FIRM|nr:hypothetical protein [Heliophilum fasciatum]MCW2279362.1 ATP-dependent DNA ligase [Heliophilum fasciatum]TCP60205.1 bifunctional non-homologous end joining protein LigD/DNA ligase-1 [Heliophilum fasciatum]
MSASLDFGSLRPMEPVAVTAPFDDPQWLFQVKWDGIRALAFVRCGNENEGIRLQSRRGRAMTVQFPEIIGEPILRLPHRGLVDGELIVLDEQGKPNFQRILRRERMGLPAVIQASLSSLPAVFMAFDLLELDDLPLLDRPLVERLTLLQAHLVVGERVQFVEAVPCDGIALFQAVQALELEGMIAKEAASPYLIGKKHRAWKKIKHFRRLDCWIIGYCEGERGRLASLALAEATEKGLRYIGNVGTGFTEKEAARWHQVLKAQQTAIPAQGSPFIPVQKAYPATVRFLEWTGNLQLRHPLLIEARIPSA